MASRLHSIPLSTALMAPKAAPFQNPTSGIRAPLTLDESDVEYSVSSKSHRNSTTGSYYSGSELESDGFVSGEDEIDSDPDAEVLEETHFVKDNAFSRPIVKNPYGDVVRESSSMSKNGLSGPSVNNPRVEIIQNIGHISGNSFSRRYISEFSDNDDAGEEVVEEDDDDVLKYGDSKPVLAVTNYEVSENEPSVTVSVGVSSVAVSHRPIALISGDSDDDGSQGSDILEDGGFSGIDKVPSIEVLQRIICAPKVRVWDLEESEDNESEDENTLERNDNEELTLNNSVLDPKYQEEQIHAEETVQEEGSHFSKEHKATSLVVNEENNSTSKPDHNLMHIDEDIRINDVMDEGRKHVEFVTRIEPTDLSEEILLNGLIASVGSAEEMDCCHESVVIEPEVAELENSSIFRAVSLDDGEAESKDVSVEDNHIFHQDSEGDKLANKSVKIGDRIVEIKEVPCDDCPLTMDLSEAPIETEQQNIFNKNEEEESNQQLPREAEHLTFDSKFTVAEISREQGYFSPSVEENLELHSGEIKEQIVIDLYDPVELSEALIETEQLNMFNKNDEEESNQQLPREAEHLTMDSKSMVAEISREQGYFSPPGEENLELHSGEINDQIIIDLYEPVELSEAVIETEQLNMFNKNYEEESNQQLSREAEHLTFDSKSMVAEISREQGYFSPSVKENLELHSGEINDQIIIDLYEPVDPDGAVNDGIHIFPLERDSPLMDPTVHSTVPITEAKSLNPFAPLTTNREFEEALSGEDTEKLEQIQQIRVKYLWLLHRLGHSPEDSVAAKVLHQLAIAETRYSSQEDHLNSAKTASMELKVMNERDSDLSLSILVIGKTGVGKSATINSIFGEKKMVTDAFAPATTDVKETIGTIDGLKVKVLDTPGLRTSLTDQSVNQKIFLTIKKLIRKSPPDVVLYVDRLDMQTSGVNDFPLLRSITTYLGSSIWHNSVIALTHAASLPPNGPDGYPLSYDLSVAQQLQVICHSVGDAMTSRSMIPVSLVENHPFDNNNEHGESWKSRLLFLCYSMKILSGLHSVAGTDKSSFMRWRSDLMPQCNLQTQFDVGRHSKQLVRAELNSKLSGHISIQTRGYDQVQIAVLALLPIAKAIFNNIFLQQKSR